MSKTILITGSTDGIGLEAAAALHAQGHQVIIHGRSEAKLSAAKDRLNALSNEGSVEGYTADLSSLADVDALADKISATHTTLDVLINNAGVFKTPETRTADGLDVRFMVNTIAPYRLAQRLLPLMRRDSRIINLSSAAQAPVDVKAIGQHQGLADNAAYAQSKLAITMWSRQWASELGESGPVVIAVNPGSFLGTKMVKEAYGMAGGDVQIGVDILCSLSLDNEHAAHSGDYFDNDAGRYASPHPDANNVGKNNAIVSAIEDTVDRLLGG